MNCDDDSVPVWEEVANYEDDDDDDDVYVKEVSNCGDEEDDDVRLCERRLCDTFSSRSLILC